jgi:2-methylisocitrate lyase-like PEP mutase family enzyme
MNDQQKKAEALRQLHGGPGALVLVNAWDAASARIVEAAGFPAIATTSAGIANALGYADGQQISCDEMLQAIARIARSVDVPVTADFEAGYADTPEEVKINILRLIEAGAVGLNLEDGVDEARLLEETRQVEKILAVQEAAQEAGVPLVLNARTDAWLLHGEVSFNRWTEGLRRVQRYRSAGADCIFTPGLRDLGAIRTLLQESPGALNILAMKGTPPIPALQAAGVRRVSLGAGPARAAMGLLRRIAEETKEQGTGTLIEQWGISYAEMNQLVRRK